MKNIHILPTDKPSRILFDKEENRLLPLQDSTVFMQYQDLVENQNIYITNDEEIKEGDYWIYVCPINGLDYGDNGNPIVKNNLPKSWFLKLHDKHNYKKIILTTDPELIDDGVQAIDDEFIEWFVKNPSCEYVEVNYENYKKGVGLMTSTWRISEDDKYKIIIPKVESKQETLEEAERMYSDEDIKNFGWLCRESSLTNVDLLFEKFKKK